MPNRLLVYSTQMMSTGGIESHLLHFIKECVRDNIQITFIVLNSQISASNTLVLEGLCEHVFVNSQGNLSAIKKISWLFTIGYKLRSIIFDGLYTNGQGSSIMWISKLIRFKNWVHHHHTSGDLADQNTWSNTYRKAMLQANTVIACSQRNAFAMKANLNREIDSIPCFSRNIGASSHKPESKGGYLEFGYYGRLIPEKGIDLICKLSEEEDLKHIKFNIWGEGASYPDSFFENFDNVNYHGIFSSDEELKFILNQLDAFILLSTHPEGLPISLLEVMSAGIPWLATNRGGIPDIALNPLTTQVIPFDLSYQEFKDKVLQFSKDILSGTSQQEDQIHLYNEKYASPVILHQWKKKFFVSSTV
ncbi:glycosyltransferase family 4 protein [Leeuwenhoekiella sp. LLG6367-2.1]|uniref:glycosyltransferase family 4 protein n=1 Tax=Leeuwenhoekiella sp. LLG6367-2.1 TaxID=3160833 RepID=UPI003869565F